MLYLSDTIYITVDLSSQSGQYLNYTVKMSDHILGASQDIYYGHIYATSTPQNIYLNDILSTHLHSPSEPPTTTPLSNYIVDVSIAVGEQTFTLNEPVISFYKDPQIRKKEIPDTGIFNLLKLRTNILPIIPRKSTFPFSCLVSIPANTEVETQIRTNTFENVLVAPIGTKGIYQFVLPAELPIGTTSLLCKTGDIVAPIATVDDCNARYFLYWYDRTGALQCQPFTKNVVMSEEFKSETKVDMIDNESVILKSVTTSWSLNSDWLSYEQYKAFESIFTSGYLYLYDNDFEEGFEVMVTDKEWVEKTLYNKSKMFKLSINVQQSKPQNILY